MSIFNFVKKLLPRIERHTVEEDLRSTEKEATNIVIPSWDAAEKHFRVNKPASEEAKDMAMAFYRGMDLHGVSKSVSFITDIQRRLPVLQKNIVFLKECVDKSMDKDILADGLTIRTAFILRAASNISLVTRYLMALLNYLYAVEAKHFDVSIDPSLELSRAEMKYVDQNFARFVKLFSEYTQPLNKITGELPEVFVGKSAEGVVAGLHGTNTIDPFEKYGLSGFVGNPIYRIRMVFAEWQNSRYESAKAKKQQLELRLLYLQMQRDDTKDPVVIKEIERLQTRIESYDKYLRDVEESIAED